jgi:hypothetical protein
MTLLTEKYKDKVSGTIGCYDRVVIMGTLPYLCYPNGMTCHLNHIGVRIFDYPKYAEPFRDLIRENAEKLARSNGFRIHYLANSNTKAGDIIKAELTRRQKKGESVEGLFYIISRKEMCSHYKPTYNEKTGECHLKRKSSPCLHYYFYFIDKVLGLCYVCVPTWLPCRLQVYFNGHNWLASKLTQAGIDYHMGDNAFLDISDFKKAQNISDSFDVKVLHHLLDYFAETFCPVVKRFGIKYHWSVMQVEYSTDVVFRRQQDLKEIYDNLVATAVHTVKPDRIASFLGRKIVGQFKGEMGNRYDVRKEGIRIKHTMGKVWIKMYDKFQQVLRIEITSTDISHFQHYRLVEHKDGSTSKKFTSMKKNIYSIRPLIKVAKDVNRRYLEFISTIEEKHVGTKKLHRVTQRVEENKRGYRGINFFDEKDLKFVRILIRGEFNIYGFRNKDLRKYMMGKSTGQVSRILKRLRLHGIIKKANNSYKYYLTKMGKEVIITAIKIKEFIIIPELNGGQKKVLPEM